VDVEESGRSAPMETFTLPVLTLGQMNLSRQALDTDLTQMAVMRWLDQTMFAPAKDDDLQFVAHLSESCDLCNTDLRQFL